MIEIHPLREKEKLAKLYVDNNVKINENSMAVVCADGDEILGYCLFDMLENSLVINTLQPQNNLMLSDGILRSALHVGVENGIMKAFYSENSPKDIFSKLKFVKNEENRELNVDKLFSSCKNCDI